MIVNVSAHEPRKESTLNQSGFEFQAPGNNYCLTDQNTFMVAAEDDNEMPCMIEVALDGQTVTVLEEDLESKYEDDH